MEPLEKGPEKNRVLFLMPGSRAIDDCAGRMDVLLFDHGGFGFD